MLSYLHRYPPKKTSNVLSSRENPLYGSAVDDDPEVQTTTDNATYAIIRKKNIGSDFKAHSFKNESFDFGD